MDTKLEKLKSLLKLVDESISRADFEKAFATLVKFVKDLKISLEDKNDKAIKELKTFINELAEKLENFNQNKLAEAQVKINQALKDQADSLNFIRDKVRKIKEGKDGKDADPQITAQIASDLAITAIKPLIPSKVAIEEEIPKLGDLIADALEGLDDEKKLKIEAIKDLRKELDELKQLRTRTLGGGGFSKIAMDQHFIDDETPTGTINGVNADFVLNNTPSPSTSLKVFVNGQKFKLTDDYTFSGKTITFLTAPPTNSLILCDYRV